jgi:hypothetical protein
MSDRLAQHGRNHAIGSAFHQLEGKRAADAVTMKRNWRMPRWSISPNLVVGERAPWVVDRNRARGFTAVRIALVHRDAAEVGLENLHRVEHRVGPIADP